MKEIGGYFGLELNNLEEYHKNCLSFNNARSCLNYILKAKRYNKIYIPYYGCEVILEPIKKLNIKYEYYHIDSKFEPLFSKKIDNDETFLYVNYFGIKDDFLKKNYKRYNNLIIDNSQSFFSEPIDNIDTFYSARKFFGVSDGAYLYTNKKISCKFEKDRSYDRMKHLLKRLDLSANNGYIDFKKSEEILNDQPIKIISNLTKSILSSIDYNKVIKIRKENFKYLNLKFSNLNNLNFKLDQIKAPMIYPLFIKSNNLRNYLIKNKIYVATYWKDVLNLVTMDSQEYDFVNYLFPLPIDQRYTIDDMERIYNEVIKGL